jgi:hypothetical protein
VDAVRYRLLLLSVVVELFVASLASTHQVELEHFNVGFDCVGVVLACRFIHNLVLASVHNFDYKNSSILMLQKRKKLFYCNFVW